MIPKRKLKPVKVLYMLAMALGIMLPGIHSCEIDMPDPPEGKGNRKPTANFSTDYTFIPAGSSIQFTDQSTNDPKEWSWYFGDGGTDNVQHPLHTYNSAGVYSVTLTVSNAYGSDKVIRTDYITVTGETGTLNDVDGNDYNTVKIGNQWWMAENLKTTKYNDGTDIQLVENTTDWDNLGYEDKVMCYYENSSTNANTYGALYTWAAAMNGANSSDANPSNVQGACPSGWHLPSDEEWKQLEMYLGMSQADADATSYRGTNEGSKLAGNSGLWENGTLENDAAFGTSGFNALPGGGRGYTGLFYGLGTNARFWSATENVASSAWRRYLTYDYSEVLRTSHYKTYGRSVRCVKD